MKIWIVLADERAAFFYDARGAKGPFDLVLKIVNPTGSPDREIEQHGRGFGSATRREDFVHRIADEIERGRNALKFERLMLASGPRMLGSIRSALSDPCRSLLAAEVKTDRANLGAAGLRGRWPDLLSGGTTGERQ
jgi:protein required for attachment to host cells